MTYHWIGRETDELREFDLRKLREAIADHAKKNPMTWQSDLTAMMGEVYDGQAQG